MRSLETIYTKVHQRRRVQELCPRSDNIFDLQQ